MANRYPLVLDTTDGNKIKELPSGDSLNLFNNSIHEVGDINSIGTIDAQRITVQGTAIQPQQFTDLTDVPDSYQGQAFKVLTVTENEDGIAFSQLIALGEIQVSSIQTSSDIFPNIGNSGRVGTPEKPYFEINATSLIGDLKDKNGSVVFDADTGSITYAAIFGAPDSLSEFINDSGFITSAEVNNIIASGVIVNDFVGSVFGDDSTVLVDGVNSQLITNKLDRAGATDGQALVWSDANNQWEPGASASGGVDLTAFNVTQNAPGQAELTYNNTTGVFEYTPPDLTTLGTITVDGLEFSGTGNVTITSGGNLVLDPAGDIEIRNNAKITGLANPTNPNDAVNLTYLDTLYISLAEVKALVSASATYADFVNNIDNL